VRLDRRQRGLHALLARELFRRRRWWRIPQAELARRSAQATHPTPINRTACSPIQIWWNSRSAASASVSGSSVGWGRVSWRVGVVKSGQLGKAET
jgi:hypothetical protein